MVNGVSTTDGVIMSCSIFTAENRALFRGFTVILAGACLPLTSTACWETHTYSPTIEETIEIGALVALSGPNSGAGPVHLAAMECALEDARAELDSDGLNFQLSFSDTQSDPYAASVLMNTHLLRNIRVTIGPFTSAEVAAVEPRIAESQSLLISPSSTSLHLANRNDHVFRLAPNDSHMAKDLVDLIRSHGKRYVLLVYRDDVWGQSVAEAVDREFAARGGTIISAHSYDPNSTAEFSNILRQVQEDVTISTGGGATTDHAILIASFGEGAQLFSAANDSVPELRNLSWYGSGGFVGDWSLFAYAELAAFAVDVAYTAPAYRVYVPDGFHHVIERIEYRTGVTPGSHSLLTYDATRIAAFTLARVGQHASYGELEDALRDVVADYVGVSGCVHLDVMGDRYGGDYDFYTVRTDGWTFWWERVHSIGQSEPASPERAHR